MTATLHLVGSRPAFYNEPGLPCTTVDPDLFYSDFKADQAKAVSLCGECPFQRACDEWATENGEKWGVWAGKVRRQPPVRRHVEDAALEGTGSAFRRLTDEQKRTVVESAISRGMTWAMLAQTIKISVVDLLNLAPEAGAALAQQVTDLHRADRNDSEIADTIGLSRRTIKAIRERLGLPAKFSTSGHPLPEPMTAATQQAEYDQLVTSVRNLYDRNLSDTEIAAAIGRPRGSVRHIRAHRLGLPTKPGKPGRPRKPVAV